MEKKEGCKIIFHIGTQIIELQTSNTADEFNNEGLYLVVKNIKDNSNKEVKDSLLKKIEDIISTDSAIKDYTDGDIIPNITGQQLRQMFPDEKWGTSIPDILLVNDNDQRLGGSFLYAKRVFQNNKAVYIVPISNIRGFALTTRALDVIEQIRQGVIKLEGTDLENIHEKIKTRNFKQEEKNINEDIEKHKKALVKAAEKELEKINKKEEIKRIEGKIQTAQKNSEAHPKSVRFPQQIEELRKDLKRAELLYDQEKNAAEKKLEQIKDKDSDIDGFAYSLTKTLEEKEKKQDILKFETEATFLEHFIKNVGYWRGILPTDVYYNIYRSFSELLGWNFNSATQDKTVLTIESLMSYDKVQKQSFIKIKDLYNYFIEKGIIKKDETLKNFKLQLRQLLDKYYNGKENNYILKYIDDSGVVFKRRFETLAEQLKIGIDTTMVPKFQEQYKGFFIFKVEIGLNEERYFFTRKWISKRTLESTIQSFSDIDGLKEKINSIINDNFSIYYNSHVFLNDSENLELIQVRKDEYKIGDIIGVIDYKKGTYSLPYRYTKELFYAFIDSKFTVDYANQIKQRIDSADKMELFYSYFAKITSYEYNKSAYDEQMKNVFSFLDDMDKVKYKYYFVNYAFSTKDKSKSYVRLTDVTNYDKEQRSELPINTPIKRSSIIGLQLIKQKFGDYGIKVEIISNDEMKQITGLTEPPSGFHSGGIIYLNMEKASIGTALHEYTHLLLGLLKVSSIDKYNELLSEFYDRTKDKNVFKEIVERYKNLPDIQNKNENEKNIYFAEELFAKLYSQFLQQQFDHGHPLYAIFSEASKSIASSSLFDNLKVSDLFENAKQPLDVLINFSSQMKNARKNVGFGLIDPDVQANIVVGKFIEQNSVEQNGKDDVDGKIIKECKD